MTDRAISACLVLCAGLAAGLPASAQDVPVQRVVVDLVGQEPQPTFRTDEAIGAALDGAEQGDIDRALTPHNIAAMKSAGLRPLTYRLRTELGIQVWHWNPVGQWSDAAHRQGYWTSDDQLGAPIALSWGYRLPRRGDTVDNATDDDYSRLTDGDRASFWKSNPYLDPAVLHDGTAHPQWLVVRLTAKGPIDTAVIDWGTPHAVRYEVQYWSGADEDDSDGRWVTFPHGRVTQGQGGTVTLRLADSPIAASHVRVLLLEGSGTAPPGASDWRDKAGFAVREIAVGRTGADGAFADAVVHAPSHGGQTFAHVSSTDPWHREEDRNPDLEQPGIDRLFAGGLGFGLPIMLPTGLLFDTPENAEAELRYVQRRGYPVRQVELGEEPDGQYGEPADYGALYLTLADRLRGVAPGVTFGGPSLQSAFTGRWMSEVPGTWNAGFVDYLKRHSRLDALGFATFEYYPFDDICGDVHPKLIHQTAMLDAAMKGLGDDGVPSAVPKMITEYGFSAYSGRAMSDMPGALLMAGIVGQWLSRGGSAAYMFGYTPNVPVNQHLPCAGFGNMMPFLADAEGRATQPMPSLQIAHLLAGAWALPGHGLHRIVQASVEGEGEEPEVVAYAVERPDGRLAVMAINRSATRAHRLVLASDDPARPLAGAAEVWRYGKAQYAWRDDGENSRPSRNRPPLHGRQKADAAITLEPDSLAVIRLALPKAAGPK